MPPRKKRGGTRRGGPGRGRRGKMEPSPIEAISMEDPSLAEVNEPPIETTESPVTVEEVPIAETQVKNHKNFGKYRYLHDNSNNSANTKSGESESEDNVIFILEEQEVNDDNHPAPSPTGSAIVDVDANVNQHFVQDDDLIVYDNNDCVIEQVQYVEEQVQEMIVEGDRDDVVIVHEDESQKSAESMFEVMCIVDDPVPVDVDENCAGAIVAEKSVDVDVEELGEGVEMVEEVSGGAEVVEEVGERDVKINEITEEISVVEETTPETFVEHTTPETIVEHATPETIVEHATPETIVDQSKHELYNIPETSQTNENYYEDVALDNFCDNHTKVESANINEKLENIIEKVDDANEASLENLESVETLSDNQNIEIISKPEEPCEEIAQMETEEIPEETPPVEFSRELSTDVHRLHVVLNKDDLIEALDKLQEIKLNEEEDDLASASKILKKKGRPRKTTSEPPAAEKPAYKPAVRRTKAERKQIIPTPVTTPEKLPPPEKAEAEDDGASAFVKALELADKAAQKKIAKQKEATAKKIDRAKKSKQRSKASKKAQAAAAITAADKTEDEDENSIRRSSRIKTITSMKRSSRGKGLVKSRSLPDIDNASDNSNSAFADMEKGGGMGLSQESPTFASPIESGQDTPSSLKPVKVKSRWRRSSELEMNLQPNSATSSPTLLHSLSRSTSIGTDSGISVLSDHLPLDTATRVVDEEQEAQNKLEVERRLKQFFHLKDNQYLTERISCKEAKKMTCDCFLTEDEMGRGEWGCGEDCLNRLLMIECGSLCAVGDRCTNKRFQKGQFAPCEAFNTVKKGLGIRAAANIPYGEFILEYVGEVLDPDKFDKRAAEYSKDKNRHYYFMALRADAIIDATQKGNISRFINHSCDPNAETQKWTVNGELRIGFFSNRTILAGEEITFDYQFQRYGKEAQKCFCEAAMCRGWLGEEPDEEDDEDDEDDDEEEETVDKDLEDKPDIKEKELKKESRGISDESPKKEPKKRLPKKERILKKPRKEFFEDLDLDAEIESLQTTGLKNQSHTLKLSRLMVRSKEPAQRTKLLRLLRRGEFPCRRLFLDYHGLRLIHGWMTDAQQLAKQDRKMESLRLEILQTIATLPIPNKTMLQDSKVLSTVEKWSIADKTIGNNSPEDSESNSPKDQEEDQTLVQQVPKTSEIKTEKVEETSAEPKTADVIEGIVPLIEDVEIKTELVKVKLEKEEEVDSNNQPSILAGEVITIEINDDDEDEIRHSVGMTDYVSPVVRPSAGAKRSLVEELTNMFSDDEDMDISPSEDEDSKKEVEVEEVRVVAVKIEEEVKVQPIPPPTLTPIATPISKPQPTAKPPPTTVDDVHFNILTEIVALAQKLLEEWAGLKVVFRIPKRERIEQMKEHEREANKGGGDGRGESRGGGGGSSSSRGLGGQDDFGSDRRLDSRYRHLQGKVGYHIVSRDGYGKGGGKDDDRGSSRKDDRSAYIDQRGNLLYPQATDRHPSSRITKLERRKQFTLRLEQEESERRRRQRELWRQHEQHCLMMGTDPRFTAPYDPARGAGYHCIWNPATGQWQNYTTAAPPVVGYAQAQQQPMVLPPLPYQDKVVEMEEVAKVKFMGPIPPPVQLPAKWKCAKDKYGRPYYYNIRIRKAQWEPPLLNGDPTPAEESSSTTSSSDTSSLSSSSSDDDSETDDETSDTKLLIEIRNKFNRMDAQKRVEVEKQQRLEILKAEKLAQSKILADVKLKSEPTTPPTPINTEEDSLDESMMIEEEIKVDLGLSLSGSNWEATEEGSTEDVEQPSTSTATLTAAAAAAMEIEISSLDKRLKDELGFLKDSAGVAEESPAKKKRPGLVQEYIISPRCEKDKLQFREDLKKYKQNKEMLRKQKEAILEKSKQRKSSSSSSKSKHKVKKTVKLKLKEITDVNSEAAKKIKESFRSVMATVMVSILNSYRKPDCQLGRITNTEDFKHLARKLTHFVMLKELKHCKHIEDLICTDSVKSKAKEFVRKYMSKFGEVYIKPKDDLETYMYT